MQDKVLLAEIGAAHGLKGEVRLRLFSDHSAALTLYGPLQDALGQEYRIISYRPAKAGFICRIQGVDERSAAERLKQTRLYVSRAALPQAERDAFYHADLIGLDVYYYHAEAPMGEAMGKVIAVHDFGAGDMLEIEPESGSGFMIPFTRKAVPRIDVQKQWLMIDRQWSKAFQKEGQT